MLLLEHRIKCERVTECVCAAEPVFMIVCAWACWLQLQPSPSCVVVDETWGLCTGAVSALHCVVTGGVGAVGECCALLGLA